MDENGKLTGAINLQDFYQAGLFNPSAPDVSPADAGWRRGFQHPRTGGPVVMILRQCLTMVSRWNASVASRRFCLTTGTPPLLAAATSPQEKQNVAPQNHFIAAAGGSRQHYRPMNSISSSRTFPGKL